MFKKILYFYFSYIFLFSNLVFGNINIVVKVEREIITNHDIFLEVNYLKLLNPNLNQLKNEKLFEIAKNSLINEIIKKNEINKIISDNKEEYSELTKKYLIDFSTRFNLNNLDELNVLLKENKTYNLDQLKNKIDIELKWNNLIYSKYKPILNINKNKILQKINNLENKEVKEYFLSEILFTKQKNISIKQLYNQILSSINEIGFNNTANIYSISGTAKNGGQVGWIPENNLSPKIIENIKFLNDGEYSDLIQINNNYLILKIEETKIKNDEIDKEEELNKLINFETNRRLNQFSRVYFDKIKINYNVNEK